jgi:hypothetical protein
VKKKRSHRQLKKYLGRAEVNVGQALKKDLDTGHRVRHNIFGVRESLIIIPYT